MDDMLSRIDQRNGERRNAALAVGLERREGDRRMAAMADVNAELADNKRSRRVQLLKRQRIQAAIQAHREAEVTDWQARYYAACSAEGRRGLLR